MTQIAYKELGNGHTELRKYDAAAPKEASLHRNIFMDAYGLGIDVLTVNNGALTFSILLQRGMDIGNMWYRAQQIGWGREDSFLLHPYNVDLEQGAMHVNGTKVERGLGWLNGFYAMDAMVGPKHFGGPCIDDVTKEKLTLHDRNSYSLADLSTVNIAIGSGAVTVEGVVPIYYPGKAKPTFSRHTLIATDYSANSLLRTDITYNNSSEPQILDDGHHIQFGASLIGDEGGRFASTAKLKPRDEEAAKYLKRALEIPPPTGDFFPERCYFVEPKPLISKVDGVRLSQDSKDVTAQMVRRTDSTLAGFVAHSLDDYNKVTFWQQYGGWQFDPERKGPIWYTAAIEPANSFPGDRNAKRGELFVLQPGNSKGRTVEIGALVGAGVRGLELAILAAELLQ